MTAQDALVERVREVLAGEPTLREVAMFGGRSFMVNEAMVGNVRNGGALLLRVPAERHEELLRHPGTSQPMMGTGRSMGPNWIEVAADVLADDEGLASWLTLALDHNRLAQKTEPRAWLDTLHGASHRSR